MRKIYYQIQDWGYVNITTVAKERFPKRSDHSYITGGFKGHNAPATSVKCFNNPCMQIIYRNKDTLQTQGISTGKIINILVLFLIYS